MSIELRLEIINLYPSQHGKKKAGANSGGQETGEECHYGASWF